jgi:type IV pilus assembly protein PilB
MSQAIQRAILHDASAQDIKQIARDEGMHTLLDAARLKLTQGLTTVEEVKRVIVAEGS